MNTLQYVSLLVFLTYTSCNKMVRIGEGTEVHDPKKFPFFAQLVIPRYPTLYLIDQCGAALIARRWIITSGHCFPWERKKLDWLIHKRRAKVYMGSVRVVGRHKFSGTISKSIIKIHHHPKYIREQLIENNRLIQIFWNDLAIAKLQKPFKMSPTIQTIQLSPTFGKYKWGLLMGTGMVDINDLVNKSKVLNYALLPIKKPEELVFRFKHETNTTFYLEGIISDEGEESTGYGLYGDMGGPFINNVTHHKAPTLLGILSVIEYDILKGRVIHAVERIDLAIDFILDYIPNILPRRERAAEIPKQIQALAGSISKKNTLTIFLVLVYSIYIC